MASKVRVGIRWIVQSEPCQLHQLPICRQHQWQRQHNLLERKGQEVEELEAGFTIDGCEWGPLRISGGECSPRTGKWNFIHRINRIYFSTNRWMTLSSYHETGPLGEEYYSDPNSGPGEARNICRRKQQVPGARFVGRNEDELGDGLSYWGPRTVKPYLHIVVDSPSENAIFFYNDFTNPPAGFPIRKGDPCGSDRIA